MKMGSNKFNWNPYADQPHNVASKSDRFKAHFSYTGSYLRMLAANLQKLIPVLLRYRALRNTLYEKCVSIGDPFGVSVSLLKAKEDDILKALTEIGVSHTLIRVPSWEKNRLPEYGEFVDRLKNGGMDVVIALVQNRQDLLDKRKWIDFLNRVFSRFSDKSLFFEIGHAWNRTKWGLWDYREYLELAEPAFSAARTYGVNLLGPAVIDFEFHLYPPVLKTVHFDKVTSLLYVDRVGAPENTQFGWDLSKKITLLKAVIDQCSRKGKELWITEFNWPLRGMGKYSPASGKPNVSEEQQANFLVRYYILALFTGMVKRIYWWQLAAPGYGLIDNRKGQWRKRPSFLAYKTLAEQLRDSEFVRKEKNADAEIFLFRKDRNMFAVCWTKAGCLRHSFTDPILKVLDRDGKMIDLSGSSIVLTEKPVYICFESLK
jgi:hypothetical protein